MQKNIEDTYNKLIVTFALISDQFEKGLSPFTEDDFLGSFGEKFKEQLSNEGKTTFTTVFKQAIPNPLLRSIRKQFKQDYEETIQALINDFLVNFDLDVSLKKTQAKLNQQSTKAKEQLLTHLNQALSDQGHVFISEDKAKLDTALTTYLDINYKKLSQHLDVFKDLPAHYTHYQQHLDLKQAQTKADKSVSHLFDGENLTLEKLLSPLKPAPKVGYKIDIDNLKEQILHDIAHKKNIDINLTTPDRYALFKRMADIGLQYRSPALALFHIFIFLVSAWIHNDEKKVVQAIKQAIKEKQIFNLDPRKITLQITNSTSNGKDTITRKKGPLSEEHINELQSEIDEIKAKLQKHHHSVHIQANKKLAATTTPLTPTEFTYNSEDKDEEIEPLLRSRGP